MTNALQQALDQICTYLREGIAWHSRMGNLMRLHYMRGLGRWHTDEAEGDFHALHGRDGGGGLEKMLADNLRYLPTIDTAQIVRAESATFGGVQELPQHFGIWVEREKRLIAALNVAIGEMRAENIELYEKLCRIQKETQGELMRAGMVVGRLELGNWGGHDLGVVNMKIHEYLEAHPGSLDFNIG